MKKKLFSLLLIAVLVLSSFSAVFAAEGDKSITLTGAKQGHTYTAYQIFEGETTVGKENGKANELINIQWGKDAPQTLKDQYQTAAAAAEALVGKSEAETRAWAQELKLTGTGSAQKTAAADGELKFEGLKEGYYVVIDGGYTAEGNAPANDYDSSIIVQVVDDATVAIKGDKPSSKKEVLDNNDTNNSKVTFDTSELQNVEEGWAKDADHDFGDEVPFRLTATTASNTSSYVKYHITFEDTQQAGLKTPDAWTVSVLGKTFEITDTAKTATQTTENGTKITVTKSEPAGKTFAIRVDFESTTEGAYLNDECISKEIKVTYKSELLTTANIGSAGNKNEMIVKYSNNPEDKTGEQEGETPKDEVIVFTYKTVVDKIDEKGADLKGAGFTFYKEVKANEKNEYPEGAQKGSDIKKNWDAKIKNAAGALKDDTYYVAIANVSESETQFEFKGLDDGKYVLVETIVPAGFNPFTAVEVTIDANHDGKKLNTLTCTTPFTESNAEDGSVTRADGTRTHDRVSGEAYAEVVNNSGSILPETGGIGTTIIYILGAALVIGAGVMLVTRKKMND